LQQNFSRAYIRAMRPREILPLLALIAAGILFRAPASQAQLPERVERCLPYPTFAQELDAMYTKPELNTTSTRRVIVIDSVDFDGPITLPEQARLKLMDDLKKHEFDADSKWLDEVAEVALTGAWQDQGYFKVIAAATAKDTGSDALHEHVALTAHVEEGLQYFQGTLNFRSSDPDVPLAFSQEVLRNVYPLREGDVFSASKIRKSLDGYRQLYGARGYVDFTAEPEFEVNDETKRVSLMFVLDQNTQFRIDRVEVDGLDPGAESILRSMIKPGDVLDLELVKAFFKENKSVLPPDASLDDLKIKKNVKQGTASLRFDFFHLPDIC
jgi:Surface antigen variable number repeat